eukprot:2179953-Amphidinium_carterae.1
MQIPDAVFQRLAEKGWKTFATFAFSSSFTSGQSDDKVFQEAVLNQVLKEADQVHSAKLRRLLFESYTACA